MNLAQMRERAAACFGAGDVVEAERLCHMILAIDRAQFETLRLLALLALRRRRIDDALRWIDEALAVEAGAADAYVIRGVAHHSRGRFADALADYDRALELRPAFAGALANRAAALKDLERFEEALRAYDEALTLDSNLAEALANRGAVLAELSRYAEALASCDAAIARMPDFHEAWHNRGVALVGLQRYDEAIASYTRAISLVPDFAQSLQSRGSALGYLRHFDLAHRDFARAYAIDPQLPFVLGNYVHSSLHCGVWNDLQGQSARLVEAVRAGKRACEPLSMVAVATQAADQLACSRTWHARHYRACEEPLAAGAKYGHDRIRVAYLSADFHEHATAYLMAELFERHDRARFDVMAVSWGPHVPSAMRARLRDAFEHFVDVRDRDDLAVARLLREREVDIAVDLKGYTFEARLGILAHRPAPVQVNYLGFPGTLGAPYIDYIIADRTLIPLEDREHYSEHVAYLPDCYQPNDRGRAIAPATPPRAQHGLPDAGLVFCSFNNSYKITPEVFDVWMRLLREVDGSVLWLLEGNAAVPRNLRREAAARGIAPERLVFAPRMPLAQHLARHRHADLFLDTLPCNAHTTASDALWAGVPVLTCLGSTFAGRVAGSLVRAAGIPELATSSLADYHALALRLARDRAMLHEIRDRLARNRDTCALFDAQRTCRHLESALVAMWQRNESGLPPESFAVQ
jgi:predicted O-linked N-acetylglucosamine transferase (SPINDLY family)